MIHCLEIIETKLWGSKTKAHDRGLGITFHQEYVRGEEIIEDRCNLQWNA